MNPSKEFGLSNFLSWEVVEFVSIARRNGWVQPTVYQGVYNTVSRTIEPEYALSASGMGCVLIIVHEAHPLLEEIRYPLLRLQPFSVRYFWRQLALTLTTCTVGADYSRVSS